MATALITGASRGLGKALATDLSRRGWTVIVDARDGVALEDAMDGLEAVTVVPGDVSDAPHRDHLAREVHRVGGLDLLVNNASLLGPSPQPMLDHYPLDVLGRVFEVNTFAPLAL